MLKPNELPIWHTLLPSGDRSPLFRAATHDDAVEYCKRVGWASAHLARMTEVTDG
jgi:hypothetical protein